MMATSRAMLQDWLDLLYGDEDRTHMIVVCDTFDYEDYPVYVTRAEDVIERKRHYESAPMSRVVEIYSTKYSRAGQMAEFRAWHCD